MTALKGVFDAKSKYSCFAYPPFAEIKSVQCYTSLRFQIKAQRGRAI